MHYLFLYSSAIVLICQLRSLKFLNCLQGVLKNQGETVVICVQELKSDIQSKKSYSIKLQYNPKYISTYFHRKYGKILKETSERKHGNNHSGTFNY